MNILIIGSTGFIGKEIVKQLAQKDVQLTLLVRNKEKARYLTQLNKSNIQLITGDLTLPNLGMSIEDKKIALKADRIIHCGGPMDITLSQENAKTSFLNGAKYVAELATEINQQHGLNQFIHIVGYMSPFNDNNSSEWQNHDVFKEMHPLLKNDSPYEQMKFLADIYIRQVAIKENFPLAVINPPTVIGDSSTGETEQLTGFGLFFKIIRQGLLPIIPGGSTYRLPVIHNNIFANFVIETLFNTPKPMTTYTLVKDKNEDLNLPGLMQIVTQAMHMKTPSLVLPPSLLKTAMTLGGSQITGISKTSLNFITDRDFDNQTLKNDFKSTLLNQLSVSTTLPLVVADIDYTLTFGDTSFSPFTRTAINQTITYQLVGIGESIVLIHGLFSEGSDLFALGIALNKLTNRPIIIVDLPGFGRSPFKADQELLTPYLQVIKELRNVTTNKATFIGHSFGASLLLKGLENNILTSNQKIILLQPPIEKIKSNTNSVTLNKILLKSLTEKQITSFFLKQGLFSIEEKIPEDFFKKMKTSFSSPRILHTNLRLNNFLNTLTIKEQTNHDISIIWGNKDKNYRKPNQLKKITEISSGHHFPISQPNNTAQILANLVSNEN